MFSIAAVIAFRTSGQRLWFVVVLAFVLGFAGIGRGWTVAAAGPVVMPVIPGVTFHICHNEADGNGTVPPGAHPCCDACALGAPATLPGAPVFVTAGPIGQVATPAAAPVWAPKLARSRTPRLAQGPPPA